MGWGISKTTREMVLCGCHALKKDFYRPASKKKKKVGKEKIVIASAKEIMKQATSFIPKSFPSLGDDVEDEDEAQPKSGGGSADPKPKVQSTLVPKSLFEYPDADHCAVLDAAAAFRRLAFKGCSAVRAAYSV